MIPGTRRYWLLVALASVSATWVLPLVASAPRDAGSRGALSATNQADQAATAQERFWIAARYDATQFVTYFEPVHFGTLPTRDNQLVQPRTPDFFGPRPIATADLERVRPVAGEPFKIGGRYDVLAADGGVVPMVLTSLVKFHTDEGIGNDSYIGALGRVAPPDLTKLRGNYVVVRRPDSPVLARGSRAGLTEGPVASAVAAKLLAIVGGTRVIAAQPFTTAGGDARQFVLASVGTGRDCRTRLTWLTGQPESRILGTEDRPYCGSALYAGLRLRAVIDMGYGRTGLVVVLQSAGSREVKLVEYQDGLKLEEMRVWQTISVGD